MGISALILSKLISGGPAGRPPEVLRRIAGFLIGILLMLSFVFLFLPALKNLGSVGQIIDMLEESGIESGAFWYANVEKVGEAERHISSLELIHEKPGISPGTVRSK
jgi:hypothetical protein